MVSSQELCFLDWDLPFICDTPVESSQELCFLDWDSPFICIHMCYSSGQLSGVVFS